MADSTSAYTFCLMNFMETTVSHLDCISFAKRGNYNEQPWLFESSKNFVIGMIAIACSLTVLIGMAFGHFAMKTTTNGNRTLNPMSNVRISEYFIESNYTAPPLPARPQCIAAEESGYATVKDDVMTNKS